MIASILVGILSCTGAGTYFDQRHGDLTRADQVTAAMAEGRESQDGKRRSFLGGIEGFRNIDVEFLLKALWKDRDILTHISTRFSAPGWGLLLWMIGHHMRWFADLQSYLEKICGDVREKDLYDEEECSTCLVDQADAENVLRAYISRITPSPEKPPYRLAMGCLLRSYIPMTFYFIQLTLYLVFKSYSNILEQHHGETIRKVASSVLSNGFVGGGRRQQFSKTCAGVLGRIATPPARTRLLDLP
ncbi:hypothetical protein RhiLY_12879 [Ceratobasidium sp. AG-Ba]|nr:hypothetical protein RhiLY_12879 [Ceratobasidium sp. AG-Ba]